MSNVENQIKEHNRRNNHTTCYYPGCTETAIYSHAISKAISLKSISEDNHLLYFKPKRSKNVKNAYFKPIGINECSGFNGFCETHDNLFQQIDNLKITTVYHVKLQIYRSLCFELHKEKVGEYLKPEFTDENAIELLLYLKIINDKSSVSEDLIRISKGKLNFFVDELIDDNLAKIERVVLYILKLLQVEDKVNFDKNYLYTFSTENFKHQIFYYLTDFKIPVAINTKATLSIENRLNYYFIVVPYEDSTLILGIIPDDSPEFINEKINNSFRSRYTVIKFIESIMSSNDGWYIQPSIIEKMPQEKKDVFLNDCMFINERRFYKDYDISIFDDLKKAICGLGDDDLEICHIPKRTEYETRHKKMIDVILKSLL